MEDSGRTVPAEHTLLGEHLRNHGYHTFATGKWHNGKAAFHRSFADGDEIFFGGMADHWNVPAFHYDPSGKYDQAIPECVNPGRSNALRWRQADHIQPGLHSSEMVCNAAIELINRAPADSPFFGYVAFLAPHDPRTMPEEFRKMYQPEAMELPPNFLGGHPFNNGFLRGRDEVLAEFPRDPREIKRHLAEYYAMITH
ncbi:MAG: choline-sulfatase, partial [Lentisphaerae bacterium]